MILMAMGFFIDGYDLLVIAVALLFLIPQLHLTPAQTGLLGAASFLGAAIGMVVVGDLTDRFGRRTIFMFNLIVFVLFALVSAFVTSIPELFIARFLIGLGIGADVPTSMSYIAEAAPKDRRGFYLGGLTQILWTIGALTATTGGLIFWHLFGAEAWRFMFGFGAVPALIVLLARQSLPESPRWLLKHGKIAEANQALQAFGVSKAAIHQSAVDTGSYAQLFRHPYGIRLAFTAALFGLIGLGAGVTTIASPYVFHFVGLLGLQGSILASMGTWGVAFLGTITSARLFDRFGRIRVGLVATVIAGLGDVAMGLFGAGHPTILIIAFAVAAFFNWIGSGVWWSLSSELFPTAIRGRAQGIANGICRLTVGADIFIVPFGTAMFGFTATIIVLACTLFAMTVLFVIGKQFEPNQQSLEVSGLEVSGGASAIA